MAACAGAGTPAGPAAGAAGAAGAAAGASVSNRARLARDSATASTATAEAAAAVAAGDGAAAGCCQSAARRVSRERRLASSSGCCLAAPTGQGEGEACGVEIPMLTTSASGCMTPGRLSAACMSQQPSCAALKAPCTAGRARTLPQQRLQGAAVGVRCAAVVLRRAIQLGASTRQQHVGALQVVRRRAAAGALWGRAGGWRGRAGRWEEGQAGGEGGCASHAELLPLTSQHGSGQGEQHGSSAVLPQEPTWTHWWAPHSL